MCLGKLLEMATANLLLTLDQTDPEHAVLVGFAARLDALLNRAKVVSDQNVAGTLDDFLGALYSLILARVQGFVDRPVGTPIDIGVLRRRSGQLAAGTLRLTGPWTAGFHFNSSLLRLAAVYHRSLKILTGQLGPRIYVDTLLPVIQVAYATWTGHAWSNTNIHQLHRQVNDLKHTPEGVYGGRTVSYAVAVAALGELLDLLEGWPDLR